MNNISEKVTFWQKKTKKQKREFIFNILLGFFIVFFAFGLIPLLRVTLHNDYPIVVVSSGSMEPNIFTGDIAFIKWKDPAEIEVGSHTELGGDILLYDSIGLLETEGNQPVIHRVVGKEYNATEDKYYFITHGDNNTNIDRNKVPDDHVIGVYVGKIPKIGWVKIWMARDPLNFGFVVGGIVVILIISIVYDEIKKKRNTKDKPPISNDKSPISDDNPQLPEKISSVSNIQKI